MGGSTDRFAKAFLQENWVVETRPVYLDHNATTPLHPEVKQALAEAFDLYGNPSSLHAYGRMARERVEAVRERTAAFLGAYPDEIVFVGSGSEANNAVLSTLVCPSNHCACDHKISHGVITSKIEHPCVLETSECLCDRGCQITFINVDQHGILNLDEYKEALKRAPGLVSIMMANNEIGTVQDIKTLAALAHAHKAKFHTDAVQAVGKIPINVRDLGVDFLTLSAHKIYGPKGIGVMYVRRGAPFCPLIRGGHQEKGRRAGTENTLGIIGLGKAIEMREREMAEESERLLRLKNMLRDGIQARIPDVSFNGHPTESLHNTLNVSFDGAEGESILLYLDLEGIMVSTGSACASGSLDPSHVLLATGLPIARAHGSIRMSMGRSTTDQDIAYVLEKLPPIIARIREMSTAYHPAK